MRPVRDDERERTLDWLTAILPVWLISVFYYRLDAIAMQLITVGGFLASEVLCKRFSVRSVRVPEAILTGVLAAFCLPAAAPWWLAAVLGAAVGSADAGSDILYSRVLKNEERRWLHPVIIGYCAVRLIWFRSFSGNTLPVQWQGIDAFSSATPLAVFSGSIPVYNLWQLLFGIRAGAMGEICVVAVLLTAGYLLIRRRLRLIAPAVMLAVVSLLSWLIWGRPLYSLLAGSAIPAALLLGDRRYAPSKPLLQIVAGAAAGLLTVLFRTGGGMAEGTAYAVLIGEVLCFSLPYLRRAVDRFVHLPAMAAAERFCRRIGRSVLQFFSDFLKTLRKNGKNEK